MRIRTSRMNLKGEEVALSAVSKLRGVPWDSTSRRGRCFGYECGVEKYKSGMRA